VHIHVINLLKGKVKNMFRLDGQIAVVIGGAGGLGESCAAALAKQGAKVVIASRGLAKLQKAAERIKADTNAEVSAMQVDVTSESSLDDLCRQVVQKYKVVDVLVNAQGLNVKMAAVDIDLKKWDDMFAANVRGVMAACKSFGKVMISRKKGRIINFSSVRGIRGTKGAVDMITRMLAAEWAPYNIKVNAVAPSVVATETWVKAVAPERQQLLLSKTLLKKFATPEDVAAACVYLAAPEAEYITGQIMYVDGGLTAVG
jgi:NAD(P)-dependent dehydrogenase (short-subunit alcohol dehydrogenase family)